MFILLAGIGGLFNVSSTLAEGLDLVIRPAKKNYLIAEPVIVHISLTNKNSSETVKVNPELTLESEAISVFIAGQENDFQRYDPGFHIEPSRPRKELAPSEMIRHDQLILYNWTSKEFAFSKPGIYRIKIVLHGLGAYPDVVSNVVQIKILDPGGVDASALYLFKDVDVARLIMNMGEKPPAIRKLETLIKKYDDSNYAQYARFYLARRESQEYFSRKPNYHRAAQILEKLVKPDAKKFQLTDKAIYLQGKVYFRLGEIQKGKSILNRLIKEYPKSIIAEKSKKILIKQINSKEVDDK